MAGFDHLKRAARDQRKAAAKERRRLRKLRRRCWWTRPYGHEYVLDHEGERTVKRCVSCGKPW